MIDIAARSAAAHEREIVRHVVTQAAEAPSATRSTRARRAGLPDARRGAAAARRQGLDPLHLCEPGPDQEHRSRGFPGTPLSAARCRTLANTQPGALGHCR